MDQDTSLCRAAAVEQGIYQTMRLQAVCRNTICSTSMMWRFELAGLFWLYPTGHDGMTRSHNEACSEWVLAFAAKVRCSFSSVQLHSDAARPWGWCKVTLVCLLTQFRDSATLGHGGAIEPLLMMEIDPQPGQSMPSPCCLKEEHFLPNSRKSF